MREFVQAKLKLWFGSRMPVGDVIHLSQRSTYIWPTRAGYLLLAIVLLMMIGATNYQNNLAFALTFLIIGIGIICIVSTFKNMQGIEFQLIGASEVIAGQSASVKIGLKSISAAPHYAVGVGLSLRELVYLDITGGHTASIQIDIDTKQRGWLEIPRLMVSSHYPFGWMRTWAYFKLAKKILVYPKPLVPDLSRIASGGDESQQGKQVVGSDDLHALRSYLPGDSLSRIDWKAFAREKGLHIKEFANFQATQLCFNWMDFPQVAPELRISYLTYLVMDAASLNLNYSLILPDSEIAFNQGEQHRIQCLRALALFATPANKNSDAGRSSDE